jgi:hypothetical protein
MNDSEGVIYVPPKDGLPFLVVTFADGGMQAQPTNSRFEARVVLAKRTRRTSRVVARAAEPGRRAKA